MGEDQLAREETLFQNVNFSIKNKDLVADETNLYQQVTTGPNDASTASRPASRQSQSSNIGKGIYTSQQSFKSKKFATGDMEVALKGLESQTMGSSAL